VQYWDSITKEDLEFSVGIKSRNWDVKDPLLAGGASDTTMLAPLSSDEQLYRRHSRHSVYDGSTEYAGSLYQREPRSMNLGGGGGGRWDGY